MKKNSSADNHTLHKTLEVIAKNSVKKQAESAAKGLPARYQRKPIRKYQDLDTIVQNSIDSWIRKFRKESYTHSSPISPSFSYMS